MNSNIKEDHIITDNLLKQKQKKINDIKYIYQCEKPKKILNPHSICIEINSDGSSEFNLLNETQVKILNRGENIVLVKPINLDKTKYLTVIHNKNSKITNDENTNGEITNDENI